MSLPPFVQPAIDRLQQLLDEAEKLPLRETTRSFSGGLDPDTLRQTTRTRITRSRTESPALAFRIEAAVHGIAPKNSPYVQRLSTCRRTQDFVNVARALLADLKGGHLNDLHDLAHAEVFEKLLDSASHLLAQGYKDAAAVVAGSVLESHLRFLAHKLIADFQPSDARGKQKSGGTLNQELAAAKVYNATDTKLITAWQGIRNDAAHGHYDRVDKEQVALMIQGIQSFMSNHPA